MAGLNLRTKLSLGVLAIILTMAFLTVRVGGEWISDDLRQQTIEAIASSGLTLEAVEKNIARSAEEVNRLLSENPAMKAAAGNDDSPSVAFNLAEVMEGSRAELYFWIHRSGQLATVMDQSGKVPTAYLGEIAKPANDLFDFGGGGFGEAESGPGILEPLPGKASHWKVQALPESWSKLPLIQGLVELARTRAGLGGSPEEKPSGSSEAEFPARDVLISSWGNHVFLFSSSALVYDNGRYEGVLAAGFRVGQDFAQEVASLTRSHIAFLQKSKPDLPWEILGSASGEEGDQLGGQLPRDQAYVQALAQGRLALGPHQTLSVGNTQYVVQAETMPVAKGSRPVARLIAGNLTRRLGILDRLNQSLLTVSGVASLLALVVIGWGMTIWINRPVSLLSQGMGRIQMGDLDHPIQISSQDEMGRLAESYNQMLVELRKKEQYMRMVSKSAVRVVETDGKADLEHGGQRRVVTMFFSDIRGFTTLCEKIDPGRLVQILNRYFDAMVEIIYRHDGVLDKFIGDAIMASFEGADHPKNAVLCALEMMQECERLDREEGLGLKMGIGLHTGEVIAGFVGAKEFMNHTYLGDTVNVAARLEGISKHGKYTKVIISKETFESVEKMVDAELLELDKVKGKSETVHMYEIIQLKSTAELLEAFESEDSKARARAAHALGRLGTEKDVDRIEAFLEDPDEEVILELLKALAKNNNLRKGSPGLIERIQALLETDGSSRLRSYAVTVLALMGGEGTLRCLDRYLEDGDPRVRANVIEAVTRISQRVVLERLTEKLEDPHHRVRHNAAVELFEIRPTRVVNFLSKEFQSKELLSRAAASYAALEIARRNAHFLNPRHGSTGMSGGLATEKEKALQKLSALLLRHLGIETELSIQERIIPALQLFLGNEITMHYIEELFSEEALESLRGSGVFTAIGGTGTNA